MRTEKPAHSMRIVFYGTPEFASFSLEYLVTQGFHVVGVVTAPDKPSGRGLKMNESEVKKTALKFSLPVLQPTNLKSPEFLLQLADLKPDVQVVIAFRMLPESVWSLPSLGTFNLHASLLPQYRGAAPINHAIINGEAQTGVTTFFIDKKIDTGAIALQKTVDIDPNDNAGSLYAKLMKEGAHLVAQTLEQLLLGSLKTKAQITDGMNLKLAPKIFPEDCIINFNLPANEVRNWIRGLAPYPGARTEYKGVKYKIFSAGTQYIFTQEQPGAWIIDQSNLYIACKNNEAIPILELQQEGKKRQQSRTFLLGFRLA